MLMHHNTAADSIIIAPVDDRPIWDLRRDRLPESCGDRKKWDGPAGHKICAPTNAKSGVYVSGGVVVVVVLLVEPIVACVSKWHSKYRRINQRIVDRLGALWDRSSQKNKKTLDQKKGLFVKKFWNTKMMMVQQIRKHSLRTIASSRRAAPRAPCPNIPSFFDGVVVHSLY